MPKVSVIVPVYNSEKYIAQAVDSVLCQTFHDFELIVVDDGSTDRTAEILKRYGERLTYIYQPNSERSAARNTGIRHAKGEYLAFLDADDFWLPQKLERQVQVFDLAPEVGLVYGWAYNVDESGKKVDKGNDGILRRFDAGTNVFESLLFENVVGIGGCSTVMIRADSVRQVGAFDESLVYIEDWDLWIRIAAYYPVGLVPEPLVCYRQDSGSFLNKWDKYDVPQGRIRILKKAENTARKRLRSYSVWRKAMAHTYRWAAITSNRLGHDRKSLKYLILGLFYDFSLLRDVNVMAIIIQSLFGKKVLDNLRSAKRYILYRYLY